MAGKPTWRTIIFFSNPTLWVLQYLFPDISIAIFSSVEGVALRPAYAAIALLSLYIFLPMRNNFIAIIFGVFVSVVYIIVLAFSTYADDPAIGVVVSENLEC